MSWVRLDDLMPEHPKVIGLSDGAFRVHVAAICYASRNLTDGEIVAGVVRLFGWQRRVGELVEARLWDPVDSGFVIHDYLEYNPSRAQVLAERDRVRAGKAAGGRARAAEAPRAGGRFTSSAPAAPPADVPAERPAATSLHPDPLPLSSLSIPPTPLRTGLTDEHEQLRLLLHAQVRDLVLGGRDAPDVAWCVDLIERGATKSDIEYAVQRSLGKGTAYVRTVLESRVLERENGVDHDQLARDRAAAAAREPHAGSSRSRGMAGNRSGRASEDTSDFGDAPPGAIRASDHARPTEGDSSSRTPISLPVRGGAGGGAR